MSKIEQLEVTSRSAEGLVLWKVTDPVTMNTLISPKGNVLIIVKSAQGEKTTSVPKTLYNMLHPGKTKALIGGNKVCKKCEIFAVDQKTEFNSAWGFGEQLVALQACKDNIQCFMRANGNYAFKIQNHTIFLNRVERSGDSLSVTEIDSLIKRKALELITSYFIKNATGKDINKIRSLQDIYEEEIQDELNNMFGSYGIVCTSFSIKEMTYNKEYLEFLNTLSGLSQNNVLIEEASKGERINIDTEGQYVDKVYAPKKAADALGANKGPQMFVQCPSCHEYNEVGNKCCKFCGKPLK